jgi:hypothetical protein
VIRNAYGHDVKASTSGTNTGVRVAPTAEPAFTMPVPMARSRRGNHSLTAFTHPGHAPPSPRPRAIRAKQKPTTVRARLWLAAARLQAPTTSARPMRTPNRSIKRPTLTQPNAYASWKAMTIHE